MEAWLEGVKKVGFPIVVALALLWFLMNNVTNAIQAHDAKVSDTARTLHQICINTSILAKRDPAIACVLP